MSLSSTVAPNSWLPFSLFATYALLEKKQETFRSIRGNDLLDENNWVSGKYGGMLIAITTLSYIPRVLGLFIAKLKVTLPPVLRMEKLKHVTVAFQGSLRNGTPDTR